MSNIQCTCQAAASRPEPEARAELIVASRLNCDSNVSTRNVISLFSTYIL